MTHTLMTTEASPELLARCRLTLAAKSRSFRLASYFLPKAGRDDAALVYSLCRHIDDLADEAESEQQALQDLKALEQELLGTRPRSPLVLAYEHLRQRRGIRLRPLLDLLQGVRSDLGVVRIENDRQLLRYCYRVAGTVGLLMCPILGVTDRRALPHAIDLGLAMQLTNICRDVLEDAGRDRVYLPASRLVAQGLDHRAVLTGQVDSARLARVVEGILALAERYYASGFAGLRFIPLRSRLAMAVAGRVYRAIGLRLRRRGCLVMAGRTVVPAGGKLVAVFMALASLPLGSLRRYHDHPRSLHDGLEGLLAH